MPKKKEYKPYVLVYDGGGKTGYVAIISNTKRYAKMSVFDTKLEAEQVLSKIKKKENVIIVETNEWDLFDAEKWDGLINIPGRESL